MATIITIQGPTFYDQEDEHIFFDTLYSLPSFVKVKGQGTKLNITLNDSPEEKTIARLLVICRRWRIDISPLEEFKRRDDSSSYLWDNEI